MTNTQQAEAKRGSILSWVAMGLFALATAWVVYASGGHHPAASQLTATSTLFVVVVRVTITPTPSASPTASPTARPSRTPYVQLTPFPFVSPVPTLKPPQWAMPSVPAAGAHLALHSPNPDAMFEAIKLTMIESDKAFQYVDERPLGIVRWGDITALQTLTESDIAEHYAGGLPALGRALTSTETSGYGWPPESLAHFLRAAAVRFVVDQAGSVLRDGRSYSLGNLHLESRVLEMDGDSGREWLVAMTLDQYDLQDWFMFDEMADGQLQHLTSPWEPIFRGNDDVEFDATHDLTGDARPEIVIVANHYMMGTYWSDVDLYHWRDAGWQHVGETVVDALGYRTGETGAYALGDVNGDGRADLRVTTPRNYGFGCVDEIFVNYVWDGTEIAQANAVPALPDSGGCRIYAAQQLSDPAARTHGFERALAQLLTEGAKPDVVAWTRVQVAMGYAGQGRAAEAATMLQTAADDPGAGGYLKMVRQAVAVYGARPWPVCNSLYGQASSAYNGLGTDLDADLAYGGYPITYEPWPELVCPLETLTTQLLRRAGVPADQPPADGLAAAGLDAVLMKPLALDADPEVEWVGVLEGSFAKLLIFDRQGATWSVMITEASGRGTTILSTLAVTGTATPDLLAVTSLVNTAQAWTCAAGQAPLSMARLTMVPNGWQVQGQKWSCADSALTDLTDPAHQAEVVALLAAKESYQEVPPLPAWMNLEGYAGDAPADTGLLDYVAQIQTDTLARTHPKANQLAISALLAYLPAGDPAAERVASRLYYLSGLGYELAGDAPSALAAYASVLVRAPSSPWAWLAWARIGPE